MLRGFRDELGIVVNAAYKRLVSIPRRVLRGFRVDWQRIRSTKTPVCFNTPEGVEGFSSDKISDAVEFYGMVFQYPGGC